MQALTYCQQLVRDNHTIDQVFFYQDGVFHANAFMHPPSDEPNMVKQWAAFHEQTQTPLVVCITAAARRGVLSQQEAAELGYSAYNLLPPFSQTGLSEFFTALHDSDNLVQF